MPAPLVGRRLVAHKCDSAGRTVTTYKALVVVHDDTHLVAEAEWTRGDLNTLLFRLEDGDRFIETFYFHRWWNVFRIHSRSGQLRGWYCNITRPVRLIGRDLYYDDLALDLLVSPTGRVSLDDEDEFRALRLDEGEPEAYRQALQAVCEIRGLIERGCPPFQALRAGPCAGAEE